MRINQVSVIIGRRGCGKTTFTLELVKKHPKKVLIIDTLDHPTYKTLGIPIIKATDLKRWKSGTYRIIATDFEEVFTELSAHIKNALVVFEDCTKYIRWNIPDHIRNFIIDSKQKNLDLVFLFHGFGMVQPDLYRLADNLTMFKTNENINTYTNKIPNFGAVEKAHAKVMNSKNNYEKITIKIN